MNTIKRSQKEIERVLNWAADGEYESQFPGMSYESGVVAALEWLFGNRGDAPDEE